MSSLTFDMPRNHIRGYWQRSWLYLHWIRLHKEVRRVIVSILVGSVGFFIGFGSLILLTTQTKLGPTYSNFILMVPMGCLGYALDRWFPFKDRQSNLVQSGIRYGFWRAVLWAISQVTYLLTVCVMGMPLTIVQPVKVVAMAPFSYYLNNQKVFQSSSTDNGREPGS